MGSFPLVPRLVLSWVLRKNFLVGIPLYSGLFGEIGWLTAYSTGEGGGHGEKWGERGVNGVFEMSLAFMIRPEADRCAS